MLTTSLVATALALAASDPTETYEPAFPAIGQPFLDSQGELNKCFAGH